VHSALFAAALAWSARSLFTFFRSLGAVGLFFLGIGDSSFLFFPFGNDLLLIAIVSSSESRYEWILDVLMAALGSVVGVFLVDLVMRKVGEEGLEYFVKPRTVKRLRSKLEKHVGRVLFTATLIPPPFPFTDVVMTASAVQCPRRTILLSIFLGRLLRFTIEALLALWLGQRVLAFLNSDVVEYAVYLFVAVAVVGSIFSIRKWIRGRKGWAAAPSRAS
jgi:membrane protein YqaA with SNARE-associated domain